MLDPKFIERLNKIEWENETVRKIIANFSLIKFPSNLNYQKLVQDLKEVLTVDNHDGM